jgi:hypothetical protein
MLNTYSAARDSQEAKLRNRDPLDRADAFAAEQPLGETVGELVRSETLGQLLERGKLRRDFPRALPA